MVRTVQEEGWAGLTNGQLLRLASGKFDVLITADQRMRYQQNLTQFEIGIVVLETFDTTLSGLRGLLPEIRAAIDRVKPGAIIVLEAS